MLYAFFDWLEAHYDIPGAGLFRYISFRSSAALILSLIIAIGIGDKIIRYLRRKQIGETIRELGLEGEQSKAGTPTMGGVIIIAAIVIPVLLLCDLTNMYIQLLLLSVLWLGAIGLVDDYIKIFHKKKEGLKAKVKLIGQVALGTIVGIVLWWHPQSVVRMDYQRAVSHNYPIQKVVETEEVKYAYVKSTLTNMPFIKDNAFDYNLVVRGDGALQWVGWLVYVVAIIFILTAVSNAANLTDGLDGLLAGVGAIIGVALGIFAYVSGNTVISEYLKILYLPHTAELVILSAAFVGACVGFLWYNSYPASVFMGDTGSLTIGGIIAILAITLRKELLIPILCGVFFAESLSVILQVAYFKYTKRKYGKGRRIFRMSPLHHHFQKMGLHEAKIVTRFWIVQVFLAVLTVVTLKIR